MAHDQFVNKHAEKCSLLPNEEVNLFDGSGFESFSKVINTCVANCPTERIIIFSHKVYPTPADIEKILSYTKRGYAFVGLYRFAFVSFEKELFRKIGFFDERYIPGGAEDEDYLMRLKESDHAIYISYEAKYVREKSAWRSPKIIQPSLHFKAKWDITENLVDTKRVLLEEKYSYDLGPATHQQYLDWSHTEIAGTNINDKRLDRSKNPDVIRYLKYRKMFENSNHV